MSTKLVTVGCTVCLLSLTLTSTVSAGLTAWWKLDEGSGTAAGDASGMGKNGVLNGGAKWVAGKDGGGVYLDGVDDYIAVPNLIGKAGSMAFWFKPDWDGSDPEDYRLFDASTSTIYFFLAKGANHTDINPEDFGFYLEDATDADYQGIEMNPNGVIFANTWFHVVVTWQFEGGPAVLYLDGEEVARAPSLGPLPSLDANPRFGLQTIEYIPSRHGAKGVIDDIRMYDRALKPGQAKGLSKGIAPDWRKADDPDPADGAIGVSAPLLRWTKGETAVFHNVYLGQSPELTEAELVSARQPFNLYYHLAGLEPGATYYWRVDEIESNMTTIHTGTVWSFTARARTAYLPEPADGSMTTSPAVVLTWYPGLDTVTHQLYLGTDRDAVTQGTADADKGTLSEATFDPNGLEEAATYYWRVDETRVDSTVQTGEIWSFTTYAVVDDFEGYTDDEGSRIYESWIDGYSDGSSGSTVGNIQPPFAEQTIVHGGLQSMPIDYNNVAEPCYSEAVREFAPAQDWTLNETNTLLLYVRGRAANSAAPLYLAVEDASQQVGVVVHPDPTVATTGQWTEWRVAFSELAGVNLTRVKKMYIGLGDRDAPTKGGAGRIYVDDIARAIFPPSGE
jgi:hypothetical protein